MTMRVFGLQMVLVLAIVPMSTRADSPPAPPSPHTAATDAAVTDTTPVDDAEDTEDTEDSDATLAKYKQAELTLFDALSTDSSPRMQALAGRIYIASSDDTPTALRPKREDVLARAVQLAQDDMLVQWVAAAQGSYAGSACGPTQWPDAAVANLLRLEPDNAAALQFGVALASAKNDPSGVDEALSRTASAARADDHLTDELAAWTTAYTARPDTTSAIAGIWRNAKATPQANALLSGLQRVSYRSSPAASPLEAVCRPDGSSDRTWQRLGWCADIARLLASKGSSLELREQGLKLLAVVGDHSDATAELQRQYDWLEAHGASPLQNIEAMRDAPADVQADWQGARSEIDAIERRLKRTGQPLTPPSGWMKDGGSNGVDSEPAGVAALQQSYMDYLKSLVDDMRNSGDVRERALALGSAGSFVAATAGSEDAPKAATKSDALATDPLADLAAANPDNLLVQWIAATATNATTSGAPSAAIPTLQRLDADNAAAWALSLSKGLPAEDSAQLLKRIAASKRYDEHTAEILGIALAAVQRHPLPAELADSLRTMAPNENVSTDTAARSLAFAMVYSAAVGAPSMAIYPACTAGVASNDAAERKESCVAIGRLLLHSSQNLVASMVGTSVLRKLDSLDAADQDRARHLAWWQKTQAQTLKSGGAAINAYFGDVIVSGSEIEALRLGAERLGKTEPPAGWKSPAEKRAAALHKQPE